MNVKKLFAENLFPAFFCFCASVLAESALFRAVGVSAPLCIVICAAVFSVCAATVYINRKSTAVYIGAAAVLAIALLALRAAGISIVEYTVQTAANFVSGGELSVGARLFTASVMSLAAAAALFPLAKIRYARLAAAALSAAALILFGFGNTPTDAAEAFCAAGIIISALAELSLSILYKKELHGNVCGIISFLLPLIMLFSACAAAIPPSAEPVKWELVKSIASDIKGVFQNICADISFRFRPETSEFGISMQGYSDTGGTFSGNLIPSDKKELKLSYSAWPRAAVYLTGNVCSVYDLNQWGKNAEEGFGQDDYYLDYCETLCAFERAGYDADALSEFTKRTGFKLCYEDIITRTLFYPLKTYRIEADGYNAEAPSITFDGKIRKGDEYSVSYVEINYRSEEFTELARSAVPYSELENAQGHYLDVTIPVGIENTLAKRAEHIKAEYAALPDTVTKRTRELADEITAGCTNDYDKLRAIEDYLVTYSYTLTPGEIPEGSDAVDYFLFESKEGFCTYFATAMAVLARCENIPTRYVQGFSVDYSHTLTFMNYAVLASDAHAWTEGYIEGIGWIPFEPTPALSASRYGFRDSHYPAAQIEQKPQRDYSEYESESGVQGAALPTASRKTIPAALTAVAGLIIAAALYVIFRTSTVITGYKKSGDTEKFLSCYKFAIYIFGRNKLAIADGETASAFAERASVFYKGEVDFGAVTEVFEKIRYGGEEATQEERANVEKYVSFLLEETEARHGKTAKLGTMMSYFIGNSQKH